MTNQERRKLTPEQVITVRRWWQLRQRLPNPNAMARSMGVNRATLLLVAQGYRYKDI